MQNTQHWIIFGWTRQGCHSCEKQGNPCERGATWLAGSHVMENLNQALGLHSNPAARAGGVLQVPKHSALEMVSHSKNPSLATHLHQLWGANEPNRGAVTAISPRPKSDFELPGEQQHVNQPPRCLLLSSPLLKRSFFQWADRYKDTVSRTTEELSAPWKSP